MRVPYEFFEEDVGGEIGVLLGVLDDVGFDGMTSDLHGNGR